MGAKPEAEVNAHEPASSDDVRTRVVEGLRDVYDPCCREKGISVVDMGLVHDVHANEGGVVRVGLLLTSGWCPFAARVLTEVTERVESLAGVTRAEVEVVWDEAWTTDRLSPDARRKLEFLPPPSRVGDRDAYVLAHGGGGPQKSTTYGTRTGADIGEQAYASARTPMSVPQDGEGEAR